MQPRVNVKAGGGTSHRSGMMCPHYPPCPSASGHDREAARTIAFHPEQGWSLLCNGVVFFEDTGQLLPDGQIVPPRRPVDVRWPAVA
jgi:hypothetical protein